MNPLPLMRAIPAPIEARTDTGPYRLEARLNRKRPVCDIERVTSGRSPAAAVDYPTASTPLLGRRGEERGGGRRREEKEGGQIGNGPGLGETRLPENFRLETPTCRRLLGETMQNGDKYELPSRVLKVFRFPSWGLSPYPSKIRCRHPATRMTRARNTLKLCSGGVRQWPAE